MKLVAIMLVIAAIVGCTTLDNGCHLQCKSCTDLDLKCDIHGTKHEPMGIPL